MSEILYKGLASPLKLEADEWIASLKTDGGEWLPDEKIAKIIVAKFTEASTAATESAKDKSYKNGQSEMSKKFSKLIKNSGFENPDNLSGDEYFEAFAAWKPESGSGNTPNATPLEQWKREDLENLPIVKSLKLEAVQAGAQKYEALKKDFDTTQAEFEQYKQSVVGSKTKSIARKAFEKALEKGNIVLQVEGMEIDRNERVDAAFERFWSKNKVGLNKEDNPIFLDEDGEEKLDLAFGRPFDFDEVAVSIAKPMYGVSAQNPNHAGSGIKQTQNGKPGEYVPTHRFATIPEYDQQIMNSGDAKERLELEKSKQFHITKAAGN